MTARAPVVVEASLDDLRSDDVRFLQEAARRGRLHVRVPSDQLLAASTGKQPKFPALERLFLAESIRWVESATIVGRPVSADLGTLAADGATLVVRGEDLDPAVGDAARAAGVPFAEVPLSDRAGFPVWIRPRHRRGSLASS